MSVFGPEFEQIWPKAGSVLKLSDFGKKLLKECESIKKPETKEVDIDEFQKKSSNFPLEFGTNTCRVMSQPKDRYPNIQKQIASAYPVIHERVLKLYLDFLEHKCAYGNTIEKEIYRSLSLNDFVQRLLTKRCATFVGHMDGYLLLTGEMGSGDDYVKVGTSSEKEPLTLKNCLSYDEIKLSVFLSVSSYTELINDGTRHNCGVVEEDPTKIEREGVVINYTGARFQRPGFMECQDIIISSQQNIEKNGYGQRESKPSLWESLTGDYIPNILGNQSLTSLKEYRKLWRNFYEESDYLYTDISKDNRRFGIVVRHTTPEFFDIIMMKKRFAISFDTLLIESQSRAAAADKQAYLHIVGIGLGTWRIAEQQTTIFLEAFMQRVLELLPLLNNIGVLHFSWFGVMDCGDLKNNGFIKSETHPLGGIRTFLTNRNPAKKLQGKEFENMILMISYAGDGNSLPGNEFWFQHLDGSSDSSTASSTLITELHNPHINTDWVCGENLHIASLEKGIIHISEFAQNIAKEL